MSDSWDFYLHDRDGHPASTYVDLGLEEAAPLPALPHLAVLRLRMNQPREDGLSSREEFDLLNALEDDLRATVTSDDVAYVGRTTAEGHREFSFYVADPVPFAAQLQACMDRHPDYAYQSGTWEDPDWTEYLNVLLPGPRERQHMENAAVCRYLESLGDTLTQPRDIDHFANFPDEASAQAFIAQALTQGFRLADGPVRESEDEPYSVQLVRADTPHHATIDALTDPLFEAAQRLGGQYDGWGCEVQEDGPAAG